MTGRQDKAQELAEHFRSFLLKEYGVDLQDVLQDIERRTKEIPAVPLTIFSTSLSTLETVVKYLREVRGLPFRAIGNLLQRHPASLTTSYRKSLGKYPETFSKNQFSPTVIQIPLSIFSGRKLSPLESLVSYLATELGLRLCDIARMLQIDQRTVWTVKARAQKKLKEVVS